MISNWRQRRAMRRAAKNMSMPMKPAGIMNPNSLELRIPADFRCPISLDLMKDPVTLSTGITYDRESIEAWMEAGNSTCPVTNQVISMRSNELIPNHNIRRMIQDWCVENRSYGIERIPTPRIPVSTNQVIELLSGVTEAARRGDDYGSRELLEKMKNLMKESERNKRCIIGNGAASVLSAAFESFATIASSSSFENQARILEEILGLLSWMLPLESVSKSYLASPASLRCMAWFLKCGDISSRRTAVLAIRELCSDPKHVDDLAEMEEIIIEPLFKLVKSPICPTATKASLMAIYFLISSSSSKEALKSKFAEMGMVSLLLEILVESEKNVCERALCVLDEIIDCEEGLKNAYEHALTMPVLVKKLLRVSDLATEFAVSAILKLCKNKKREDEEGRVLVETLQVGAFQKLLLLLQVGCGEKTKEKATDLLKILNVYRNRSECIESADFKELERPF